jgi:putative redox protein
VIDILRKGRHGVTGLHITLSAERAAEPPRRLTRVALHFAITGPVPEAAAERAIALSREKYCSVWHSLRQDIDFRISFKVEEGV